MIKRIKSHYGSNDFFRYYQKHSKYQLDSNKYRKILNTINYKLMEKIITDNYLFVMPYLNFRFFLTKNKQKVFFKNDKVINTSPIDWKTTKKLWENDEEAKKKKILIRYINKHTNKYIFKIIMHVPFKTNINYKYYKFRAMRSVNRNMLAKKINNNEIDLSNVYIIGRDAKK